MLGTLNGGLEARGIKLAASAITAEAVGEMELVERLPMLTRIVVNYSLKIPAGTRETVERLLEKHQDKCPTATMLKPVVEVSWRASVEEA